MLPLCGAVLRAITARRPWYCGGVDCSHSKRMSLSVNNFLSGMKKRMNKHTRVSGLPQLLLLLLSMLLLHVVMLFFVASAVVVE